MLLGRAPITDCTVAPAAAPGTVDCERQTEGSVDPAYFGGATPDDNSGTIDYVQIRYSGYVLSGNSELQSLTLRWCGKRYQDRALPLAQQLGRRLRELLAAARPCGTSSSPARMTTASTSTPGYQGTIQYLIAVQKSSGAADSMIELDSANALEDNTPAHAA